MSNRTTAERHQAVLSKLEKEKDVWVASADAGGKAHLVPFSLDWDGEQIIVTTEISSKTARNMQLSKQARLAVGTTRDVVLIDIDHEISMKRVVEADERVSSHFRDRTGWDPREASGDWVYFFMRPNTVLAWNSEPELKGRVIMRKGVWLK